MAYVNPDYPVDIIPLMPQGTNSTMFTACCGCAICSDQRVCPVCGRKVVGADAETDHGREQIRWKNATAHWRKKKVGEK